MSAVFIRAVSKMAFLAALEFCLVLSLSTSLSLRVADAALCSQEPSAAGAGSNSGTVGTAARGETHNAGAPGASGAPIPPYHVMQSRCAIGEKGCSASARTMYAPPPVYTKAARKAKVSGIMLVWVTVTPDGGARDVTIEKKLGYGLDEQTVKAVKGWRFKPATIDGKPIESRLMIEMNFKFKLN